MLRPGQRQPVAGLRHHGDAVLDRADVVAQIAADAFGIDHLIGPLGAVRESRDGLMRRILAGDVAKAAADAEVWIYSRHRAPGEVEILPMHVVGNRAALEGGD